METQKEVRKQIASIAEESFKDHVLSGEVNTSIIESWRCGRPDGSSTYFFRIVFLPRAVLVYGDVGNKLFSVHDNNTLSWLLGAVNSPDYVMGKCEDAHKHRSFFPGDAKKLIVELREEGLNEQADLVEDNWSDESDEHQFAQAWYDAGLDIESIDSCYDFDSDVVWSYACMKKFCELYRKQNNL